MLTFADVAGSLGVSQARVTAMVEAGHLTTLKFGDFGARMVPLADVERFQNERGG